MREKKCGKEKFVVNIIILVSLIVNSLHICFRVGPGVDNYCWLVWGRGKIRKLNFIRAPALTFAANRPLCIRKQ